MSDETVPLSPSDTLVGQFRLTPRPKWRRRRGLCHSRAGNNVGDENSQGGTIAVTEGLKAVTDVKIPAEVPRPQWSDPQRSIDMSPLPLTSRGTASASGRISRIPKNMDEKSEGEGCSSATLLIARSGMIRNGEGGKWALNHGGRKWQKLGAREDRDNCRLHRA